MLLIDVCQPVPATYQKQIDHECDALALVMADEVHNTSPEAALSLSWVIHATPLEAESALSAGLPCIISPILSLYATGTH